MNTEFFEKLYQLCDEGMVELRALPSKRQQFVPVESLVGLDEFCGKNGDNYYFGVALRSGAGGGTKKDITQIPALHADCDFKDTPRDILFEKIKQFPFKPSLVVKSGGGAHLYFILDEPAGQNDIERVEDANRRIAAALGGDLNACDASRILRIPGTANIKYEPPRACELTVNDNFTYSIDDFLGILPEANHHRSPKGDTGNKPGWLQELMAGVNEPGRNAAGTKIAGHWINKLTTVDVLTILQTWNLNNSPPLDDKELQTIVQSVSRYQPDIETKSKVDISNVYDAAQMVKTYQQHIANLKKNRFILGIPEIDKRIRGVAGGEVLTILARSGSFKTAMLQNMLKNYVKNSAWGAVFFSIEMPVASVTERYFQMFDGCTGREVESMFTDTSQNDAKDAAIGEFVKDLGRFFVIPTRVSLSDIAAYVKLIETEKNVKVGVIGIDYLGLMDGPGMGLEQTSMKPSQG